VSVTVPEEVAAAWGWKSAQCEPLTGGLINETFAVHADGAPIACVQRLHAVFAGTVNLDIDAVTTHVAARGVPTPRVLKTRDGRAWVDHDGRAWRALSWVDGASVHQVPAPAWAGAAGALVGRWHRAVADLQHDYAFVRVGVHDTQAHLARLRAHAEQAADPEGVELAQAILADAASLPEMPDVPQRHIHGDLKISNVMFEYDPGATLAPPVAHCLVDLDTVARGTLAFELGDAMRSWCNPRGEDAGGVVFDLEIFAAAMRGYRHVADAITTPAERASVVVGLETVCVELAARFANDVFEDRYFGWDAKRFPSRRAHNLVRARGQLALGLLVRASRADAMAIVVGA
jgi:Ser/Thr protein kinase RdoA (MazF antagonist)